MNLKKNKDNAEKSYCEYSAGTTEGGFSEKFDTEEEAFSYADQLQEEGFEGIYVEKITYGEKDNGEIFVVSNEKLTDSKKIKDSIELYERAAEKAKSLGQEKRAGRFSSYAEQLQSEATAQVPQLLRDYFMDRLPGVLAFINGALSKNGLGIFEFSDFNIDKCGAKKYVGDDILVSINPDPACVCNVINGYENEIDTCVEDNVISKDYTTVNYIDFYIAIDFPEEDIHISAGFDSDNFSNVWFDTLGRTENQRLARLCASICKDLGVSEVTKADFIA